MPFAPIDDIPAVDAAFRAWGADLEEVFRSAWNAVRAVLTGEDPDERGNETGSDDETGRSDEASPDSPPAAGAAADPAAGAAPNRVPQGGGRAPRALELEEGELEYLLLEFLQEQLYLKDAEAALYVVLELSVERRAERWAVAATLEGVPIEQAGARGVDVKAVTLDHLGVRETNQGWEATVVLDL